MAKQKGKSQAKTRGTSKVGSGGGSLGGIAALVVAVCVGVGGYSSFATSGPKTWGEGFVVSIVAYDRPHYLKQILGALGSATNVEKYTVLFNLEPCDDAKRPEDCKEVHEVARNFTAGKVNHVAVNEKRKGCEYNIKGKYKY
jgi:hypothetical protein